jgi:O-acetylserine/cysteine efflux transporter
MTADRRRAIAALTTAGLAWGTTVPLSKLALGWLSPGWLTVARFGLAAAILLVAAPRTRIRTACTPTLLASGAVGYGASVVVQNAGIARTSVSYAALLVGASPVLVAVIAAAWHRTVARPAAWAGFVISLAGVALLASGPAGGASAVGDGLVLASLLLSAAFTVAQTRLLSGRDPVAVTAVQFLGAALAVLPFTVVTEGLPTAPHDLGPVLATAALAVGGTMLPFTMFAYGQSRVSAEVAGAFVNLEPLIGAAVGIIAFGDPLGLAQIGGGAAIITGITISTLPLLIGAGNSLNNDPGLQGPRTVRQQCARGVARRSARAHRCRREGGQGGDVGRWTRSSQRETAVSGRRDHLDPGHSAAEQGVVGGDGHRAGLPGDGADEGAACGPVSPEREGVVADQQGGPGQRQADVARDVGSMIPVLVDCAERHAGGVRAVGIYRWVISGQREAVAGRIGGHADRCRPPPARVPVNSQLRKAGSVDREICDDRRPGEAGEPLSVRGPGRQVLVADVDL